MQEPIVTLIGHQRRVGIVEWHPSVQNVLLSAGFDYMLIVWNTSTGKALREISCHTDTIYRCVAFAFYVLFLDALCKSSILLFFSLVVSRSTGILASLPPPARIA